MILVFLGSSGNKVLAELSALPNVGDTVTIGTIHYASNPTLEQQRTGSAVKITKSLGSDWWQNVRYDWFDIEPAGTASSQ